MEKQIEYRVRPITRYVVTRYEYESDPRAGTATIGGSSQHGVFDNATVAYEVGYALCKAEHDRLGWPLGDIRIKYPLDPSETSANLSARPSSSSARVSVAGMAIIEQQRCREQIHVKDD